MCLDSIIMTKIKQSEMEKFKMDYYNRQYRIICAMELENIKLRQTVLELKRELKK